MDFVKRINETLHIGSDWGRVYEITGDVDFNNAYGLCKVRTLTDKLVLEAECTMDNNRLVVWIRGAESLKISRKLLRGKYDVFLITEAQTIKLVMGTMTFVPEVSMH